MDFYDMLPPEYREIFENALSDAIKQNSETPAIINPPRYAEMLQAKVEFDKLLKASWSKPCEVKFHPTFCVGSLSAEVEDFEVTSRNMEAFCAILKKANTFSVTPRTNGNIHVSLTFNHVMTHIK